MYRKVTVLLMVALAVTLSMATVASTAPKAPKETRTVCQDGVTKEIPAHAKAKGATEGPCEPAEPVSEAERVCLSQFADYDPTFIPPDTCEYTVKTGGSGVGDLTWVWYINGVYQVKWQDGGYDASLQVLISYEPTACWDLMTDPNSEVDLSDPRCQIPLG